MKHFLITFALIVLVFPMFAQQTIRIEERKSSEIKTLFKPDKRDGFYLGSSIGYSPIDNSNGLVLSSRFGWIMDRWFTFGLSGSVFANNIDKFNYSYSSTNDALFLGGAYGGLFIEPILAPMKPIHLSFPVIIGGGGAVAFNDFYSNSPDDFSDDVFFMIEPGMELEVNFTRWMRIAAFVSYRYTSDINMDNVSAGALRNYTTGMSFKIGWF
jgi:hypothetical protein